MHMARIFCFLLLCISCFSQTMPTGEDQFRSELENKVVQLRFPSKSSNQKYDCTGAFVGDPDAGPWTLYDRIQISRVQLKSNKLHLEGRRVFVTFGPGQSRKMVEVLSKDPVKLDVGCPSATDQRWLAAALPGVFLKDPMELLAVAPIYWRWYLRWGLGSNLPNAAQGAALSPPQITPGIATGSSAGIEAPKLKDTHDPEYSPEAKAARVQGTSILQGVVGVDGSFRQVFIRTPLGWGLDEKAVEAVEKWRFEPAQKDGKPIPVTISVEVNFHLY
jgi:TonB family protein